MHTGCTHAGGEDVDLGALCHDLGSGPAYVSFGVVVVVVLVRVESGFVGFSGHLCGVDSSSTVGGLGLCMASEQSTG